MVGFIVSAIYLINAVFALITILIKPRDVAAIWAWLLVLFALPIVGFVLYLFFGRGLTDKKKFYLRQSDLKELENFQNFRDDTIEHYDSQTNEIEKQTFVDFFSSLNQMPLTRKNGLTLLTDGQEKLTSLLKDIEEAQHSIHIEYYAFVTDEIGNQILRLLEKKQRKEFKFAYFMMRLAHTVQKQKILTN